MVKYGTGVVSNVMYYGADLDTQGGELKTLEAMKSWNMDFLIPCHCTGDNAMQQMKDYLGDIVTFGHTGTVIALGELPRKQEGDYSMCRRQTCGCGCA